MMTSARAAAKRTLGTGSDVRSCKSKVRQVCRAEAGKFAGGGTQSLGTDGLDLRSADCMAKS